MGHGLAAAFAVWLGIGAVPALADEAPTTEQMVRGVIEGVIQPGYAGLSSTARRLGDSMDELCATPSAEHLEEARGDFGTLVDAWSRIEMIRFGPIAEDNGLERFLFWPDRRGIGLKQVQAILAKDDATATAPETLAAKSVAVQGLGALEFVLFGTDADSLAGAGGTFRCAYGRTIVAGLHERAENAFKGWMATDGVAGQWINPGPDNPLYRTESESLGEIVGILVEGLELVRDVRIGGFLGATAKDDKPKQALFWRSGRTIDAIDGNLAGLRLIFEHARFRDRLPADTRWIADSVAFEFGNAGSALFPIEAPVASVLDDPDKRSKLAYTALVTSSLSDLIGARLSAAFGLTAGISSLDGD